MECSRRSPGRSPSTSCCSRRRYEVFASSQPWIRDFELSPKSVVRDMYERACSFGRVRLAVPARAQRGPRAALPQRRVPRDPPEPSGRRADPDLLDLIAWLGEVVRQVDSSLVDEWEQLINPADVPTAQWCLPLRRRSSPTGARSACARAQTRCSAACSLAALQRDGRVVELDPDVDWPSALDSYFDEHDEIRTGGAARSLLSSSSTSRRL